MVGPLRGIVALTALGGIQGFGSGVLNELLGSEPVDVSSGVGIPRFLWALVFSLMACGSLLIIAFRKEWLQCSFWMSGVSFWISLRPRLFALLPLVTVGSFVALFFKSGAIPALGPLVLISFLDGSVQSTLELIVLVAMLHRKFGIHRTALFVAVYLEFWKIAPLIHIFITSNDYAIFQYVRAASDIVAQMLITYGLVRFLDNACWSVLPLLVFSFIYQVLSEVIRFEISLLSSWYFQLTILGVGVALVMIEHLYVKGKIAQVEGATPK